LTDQESKQEEQNPSEEKLKQLEARVTELSQLVADKDGELEAKNQQILKLEKALTEKDGEIASLEQSVAQYSEDNSRLGEQLNQAVSSYQSLVIETNPEVPPELITGDTIESTDDSLAKARDLISQVRQGLEAEAIKTRIPAGAPARTPPDFSALSAREKIQYAIGGNK
jgi:predicted RNase H-like nuclease (RuvC/YqgF family)